jgi:transposase
MPVRILITQGTTADCQQACTLIEGIQADALLADRAYDTDEIVEYGATTETEIVIPPKRNRKIQLLLTLLSQMN